jgi:hypothetical protein
MSFSLQNKPKAGIINSYYSPSTQPIMLYYVISYHITSHIITYYITLQNKLYIYLYHIYNIYIYIYRTITQHN